jgi:NAD(P)H-dependent flavin oxidoreductase YrpB (nitropropane dioxygenase family)
MIFCDLTPKENQTKTQWQPHLIKLLNIEYPILVAPMFLISNTKMIKAALDNGITAAFPALKLSYR